MAKFLLGLLCGIVLCVLVAFILGFVVYRLVTSYGEKPPEIADGSTLVLKLEGELPERSSPEMPIPSLREQEPLTMEQVWETFHKASADSRIRAIVFEPRSLGIGWGKMQEIRQEMVEFRKSGKPLVAFLRGAGTREYYVSTAADRIYMTPEDMLDVKGLRLEAMYFKNGLDKIGVHADVVHAGKFKDFGDVFTRTDMSPETQEALNPILDQYYNDMIRTIAQGRKKDPEQVRAAIDKGPLFGKQALDAGFVDALGYDDQVTSELQKRLGQSQLKLVPVKTYARVPAESVSNTRGPRIAFVVGEGEILRGDQWDTLGNTSAIRSGAYVKLLNEVRSDSTIRGAILRIDSPGGDGVASDDILNAAKELSRTKPVVISMSDVAASGGYFIAMTGDPVVAYPNTLTGSIGVVFVKFDLKGLYDKLGITKPALQRGQNADLYSDYEPLTGRKLEKLREEIDEFYHGFVTRVAQGRKRPYEQIEPLAQGRVWTGEQAKGNGLVDQLGGIDAAIDLVKSRAHIAASEQVRLVVYPPKRGFFEVLFGREDETTAVEAKLKSWLGGLPVESLSGGGFLKLMPYTLRVN